MIFLQKLIIFVCIVAVAYGDDDDMSLNDVVDALESFAESCDPKPEREHIIEVVKMVDDAQYPSQCFRDCLMMQFELKTKGETKMNKEKAVEGMSMMFPDAKDDLERIVDECNEKNADITDSCNNAHAHGMCMFDSLKARGYEIPKLKE